MNTKKYIFVCSALTLAICLFSVFSHSAPPFGYGGVDQSSIAITGGTIDNTTIGASTPTTGAFTTVTTTGITATSNSLAIKPTTDATTAVQIQDKDGNAILTVDTTNDRVGIGATSPQAKLDVQGQINLGSFTDSVAGAITLTNALNTTAIRLDTTSNNGLFRVMDSSNTTQIYLIASGSSYLKGGNVGIGTTAPDKALEINSATGANLRLTYNDSNGSAANYTDFSVSSSGDLTITPSGGDITLAGSLTMPDAGKITWDIAPASDHTCSGNVFSATAGEALVFGDVCYLKSDGKYWKADADAAATMPVTAMALASISADAAGNFLKFGWARDDSWAWTIGGLLYADTTTAGGMTQTAPSGAADVIQVVGIAETATVVKFDPSPITTEVVLDSVSVSGTSQTITVADLLSEPITYYGDNSSDQTYTLTAFAAGDIGKKFTIMKTGTGAGKAIIQLPASSYAYASGQASSEAGTVYLAASTRGSMTWMITSTTSMQLVSADGSLTFV